MSRHIADEELLGLVDAELSPHRQSEVARHLEACEACRQRFDRLCMVVSDVDACCRATSETEAPSDDCPEPRNDGRARLEAALQAAAAVAAPSERSWRPDAVSQRADGPGESQGSTQPAVLASAPRRVAAAVVALAACAAAVLAVRSLSSPASAGLTDGVLPQSSLTPGAVAEVSAADLCGGVRPSRWVTETVRQQVLRAYGMQGVPASAYELDALITPELGGSTDAANLWPQRYHSPVWNARVKDELEQLLPQMVCEGRITLAEAQRAIASDWIAAYKHYFKTDVPLQAHRGPEMDDGPELLFVSDLAFADGVTVASR